MAPAKTQPSAETTEPSTNGTALPDTLCGARNPHPDVDQICEFEPYHKGRHSWDRTAAAGTVTVDAEGVVVDYTPDPTQVELPGIPEPAPREAPPETDDDFDVPYEAQFNKRIAKSAPGLKAIGERLIARHEEFAHLRDVEIRYFWKRRGGTKGGNPNLGGTQKPGGWLEYAFGATTYLIWLAADHVRDAHLDHRQIEAAVFNRLCATAVDPKDHSAYRVVGPDFTGYLLELAVYGPWSAELRAIWDGADDDGEQAKLPLGERDQDRLHEAAATDVHE